MQAFIHRKNLENYRKLLAETTDEAERRQLQKLLNEEAVNEPPPKQRDDD
jgi:hypothetical protein